ncbi:MAG: hypothetical protein U9N86_08515 [Bacteroidota bacterium]|nr:hypothetical protein [Bacteroidota bacterium]
MKASFVFLIIIFISGCSSELDIIHETQTVPVVYSLINPYDTVHYVRVQKTFIINKKEDFSTLNVDSMQFEDVEVFLFGKKGNSIKWEEQFSKIAMDKDDGFFPTENFEYFQLDRSLPIVISSVGYLNGGYPDIDTLILQVKIGDLDLITKASVPVLTPGVIIPEPRGTVIYLYGATLSKFAIPIGGESECRPSEENCYRQIEFSVHFKEYYENFYAEKEISWTTNSGWDGGSSYKLTPERLFNRMKMLLPSSDSILTRRLDSIDVAIISPCRAFSEYWFVREYWENSDNPPYTNFDNSYGMFISYKIGKQTGFVLNRQTMDSLCKGYNYKEMKFKSW